MLPVKLMRALILGDSITDPLLLTQNHHLHEINIHNDTDVDDSSNGTHLRSRRMPTEKTAESEGKAKNRIPLLLFTPTRELITDTYRLASLARDIGMDFYPNPSLSHIIFTWSTSSTSPASSSSASSYLSLPWSSASPSSSLSSSWSLPNDAVPLPFPSLSTACLSHLRLFVSVSRNYFKLVFLNSAHNPFDKTSQENAVNWDCSSLFLFSRLTGCRIDSMDDFSRALAGTGWTIFKSKSNPQNDSCERPICGRNEVYLFRKLDFGRVRAQLPNRDATSSNGEYRTRELRLPPVDFKNAPLRILQYILLMTDDIFLLG